MQQIVTGNLEGLFIKTRGETNNSKYMLVFRSLSHFNSESVRLIFAINLDFFITLKVMSAVLNISKDKRHSTEDIY